MNSFIGISEAQTTNLAIVAPGIAGARHQATIRPKAREVARDERDARRRHPVTVRGS
jgi:hypothetical protein